ncbi:hypothetical protein ANO11243_087700 [Dothideomycetidae sp. 11243]|nr:hypothetical protein ANO11243_087700 [fungal sp. No.11243]
MALQPAADQQIDRGESTPFFLRVFYRENTFHSPAEFVTVPPSASLSDSSLQLYTWPDTTLSELTSLITNALPDILPSPSAGTRIGYRLVFPDTRSVTGPGADEDQGRWLSKPLGSVVIGEESEDTQHDRRDEETTNGIKRAFSGDARKTLAEARFVIGDYISCAIIPPLGDGSVAPLPASERSGGPSGRGGRGGYTGENGSRGGGGGYAGRSRGGGGGGYASDRGFGASSIPAGDWRRGDDPPAASGGDWRRGQAPPDRSGFGGGGRGRDRYY